MQLRSTAFICFCNTLQLQRQIQPVAGNDQHIRNLLQYLWVQAQTGGGRVVATPLTKMVNPHVMGQSRLVFGLQRAWIFRRLFRKQIDNVVKQAVDLFLTGLVNRQQRLKRI